MHIYRDPEYIATLKTPRIVGYTYTQEVNQP